MAYPLKTDIALAHLGFIAGTDFTCYERTKTSETILTWQSAQAQPTEAEITAVLSAAVLADEKTRKLALLRTEAASHITAKWPLWAQNNCALGVYPDATVAQCAADIAAVIAASNTAEDAIEAATTVAEVEAVTATWPTL